MSRSAKYTCGCVINNKWIVVAILFKKGNNKKILCFNRKTKTFKEGWIWDFTRDLVSTKANKKEPMCKICEMSFDGYTKKELYDINANYTFEQKTISKNLSSENLILLRNIREGLVDRTELPKLLATFNYLLQKSGQHRRNKGLAMVIGSTYAILDRKGILI